MNDDIIESFVKARKDKSGILLYIVIFAITMLVDVLIFMFFWLIGLYLSIIVTGIACIIVVILIRMRRLEYELSLVRGEMTISEIRNQAMRKKILSFDLNDIENFKAVDKDQIFSKQKQNYENQHKVLYCFGDDSEHVYFFNVRGKDEGVTFDIFITFDERFKKAFAHRCSDAKSVFQKQAALEAETSEKAQNGEQA